MTRRLPAATVPALAWAFLSVAGEATAQARPLTAADVAAAVPGLEMTEIQGDRSRLALSTWREPFLTLLPTGFRLDMHYNGLDDRAWPFPRILDALLAKACGGVRGGGSAMIAQLYASPSLVPAQDMGGGAGRSFRKVAEGDVGACRVELLAEGARWHNLTATVSH